jgi:protein-arginine kinase activator protein McsA
LRSARRPAPERKRTMAKFRRLKIKKYPGPPICPEDGTPLAFMNTPQDSIDEEYPPAVCWFCAECFSLWTDKEATGQKSKPKTQEVEKEIVTTTPWRKPQTTKSLKCPNCDAVSDIPVKIPAGSRICCSECGHGYWMEKS